MVKFPEKFGKFLEKFGKFPEKCGKFSRKNFFSHKIWTKNGTKVVKSNAITNMICNTVDDCVSKQVLSQSDIAYYYSDINRIINNAIMASSVWLLLLLTIATDFASSADSTTATSSSFYHFHSVDSVSKTVTN